MLKLILIALIVLVAIVLILAAFKPDSFSIARSVNIKAPPEKIFRSLMIFIIFKLGQRGRKLTPP